jgi:glyoxylase-like metal-dependent hydrolase (beta-lactamase superfamily II)
LKIQRFINSPITSNCYVLYQEQGESCIIIDPGTPDCEELLFFLQANQLEPIYILLTHEHYDHIWGVNKLKDIYNVPVICSKKCDEQIIDRKKNMSLFHDEVGFVCKRADMLIEEITSGISLGNDTLSFLPTEGHSQGSISILLGNILFSGDTIIYGHKTILKFPTSSSDEFKKSIERISNVVQYPCLIMPGHGESFTVLDKKEMSQMGT